MTKALFWRTMAERFIRCDPTISARLNTDGSWTILGGTEESRREWKALATIAGEAAHGRFPPDVVPDADDSWPTVN